ncbi:unnamed protein product, partial [Didymodactylos carnosus]
LSNPIEAMFHVQPWMLLVIIPLACVREGPHLIYDIRLLTLHDFHHIGHYTIIVLSSALLAFALEFSEFLLVSNTSSLTLSISGIFKEVVMLYLAVEYNNNQLNRLNFIGLCICLSGIIVHCVSKIFSMENEKSPPSDHIASERLLRKSDSQHSDEWSAEHELQMPFIRRNSISD